jgi:hypothetical protein
MARAVEVDVKYWVFPHGHDAVAGLRTWLEWRLSRSPDPMLTPDLAQEPVILLRPHLGKLIWDPDVAPPLQNKRSGHRPPRGRVPV